MNKFKQKSLTFSVEKLISISRIGIKVGQTIRSLSPVYLKKGNE